MRVLAADLQSDSPTSTHFRLVLLAVRLSGRSATPCVVLPIEQDWTRDCEFDRARFAWLFLLDQDVQSVQLAYRDFAAAHERLRRSDPTDASDNFRVGVAETFHYAKTLVCAIRRVGRIVEAVVAHRKDFSACGEAIRIAWRKHKASFDTYVEARNAIEHIDGEVGSWQLFNLVNTTLRVTDDAAAVLDSAAVERVLELRTEIVDAVKRHYSRKTPSAAAG